MVACPGKPLDRKVERHGCVEREHHVFGVFAPEQLRQCFAAGVHRLRRPQGEDMRPSAGVAAVPRTAVPHGGEDGRRLGKAGGGIIQIDHERIRMPAFRSASVT